MAKGLVTIFGGSGFIGRYATRALVKAGYRVRVACRRPHLAGDVRLAGTPGWVDIAQANIRNRASVECAIEGADAVINLVGILFETGKQTFADAQRDGAATVAEACAAAGIDRLVHVSAIGADKSSNAKYARTKAEAETAILAAVPKAVILRPSIVFGPEDDFFNRFATMASGPMSSILPLMPAIGGGKTKLQPVYAGDVADAIVAAVTRDDVAGKIYELGGPRTYTFNELYDLIFKEIGRRRFKIPLPFWFAQSLGLFFGAAFRVKSFLIGSLLGGPPLTADQVKMLKTDNVVANDALTLADLGITEIESAETIVPTYLWRFRPYGEFSQAGEA